MEEQERKSALARLGSGMFATAFMELVKDEEGWARAVREGAVAMLGFAGNCLQLIEPLVLLMVFVFRILGEMLLCTL